MKELYQEPQMETTEYAREDVIITSKDTGSLKDLGVVEDPGGFGALF